MTPDLLVEYIWKVAVTCGIIYFLYRFFFKDGM